MLLKKYRSHHFLILLKKDFNLMDITVSAKNIKGDVDAIASKSYAHRILIAAALSDKPCKMLLNSTSEDIEATEGCIARAGGSVEHDGLNLLVSPLKNIPESAVFDCCESGSLIRFLIPVAAALGIDAVFTGRGRLPQRPQQPILEAVSRHGITVSKENEFPIKISGKLKSGEYTLPGNISSQYTTGLLFALPVKRFEDVCAEKVFAPEGERRETTLLDCGTSATELAVNVLRSGADGRTYAPDVTAEVLRLLALAAAEQQKARLQHEQLLEDEAAGKNSGETRPRWCGPGLTLP